MDIRINALFNDETELNEIINFEEKNGWNINLYFGERECMSEIVLARFISEMDNKKVNYRIGYWIMDSDEYQLVIRLYGKKENKNEQ